MSSAGLSFAAIRGKPAGMETKKHHDLSREERLAAQLRENLRRRKGQARSLAQGGNGALSKDAPKS